MACIPSATGAGPEISYDRGDSIMAEITLAGNKIHTIGELPETGSMAPSFSLTSVHPRV